MALQIVTLRLENACIMSMLSYNNHVASSNFNLRTRQTYSLADHLGLQKYRQTHCLIITKHDSTCTLIQMNYNQLTQNMATVYLQHAQFGDPLY